MKKTLVLALSLFILSGGTLLRAQSLLPLDNAQQADPSVFQVAGKIKKSKASVDTSAVATPVSDQKPVGSGFWVKGYGGYDFALMSDVIEGVKTLEQYAN